MNFLQKSVPSKFMTIIMNKVFDIIECPYPLKYELIFKSQYTERYGIEGIAL